MDRTLNIFAVFGVQIALWFYFAWWIALLSLPLSFVIVTVISFAAMSLTSKLANTQYWSYYQRFSPPLFFAIGQVASASILQALVS
jgi:uncharacterized membrane protein